MATSVGSIFHGSNDDNGIEHRCLNCMSRDEIDVNIREVGPGMGLIRYCNSAVVGVESQIRALSLGERSEFPSGNIHIRKHRIPISDTLGVILSSNNQHVPY